MPLASTEDPFLSSTTFLAFNLKKKLVQKDKYSQSNRNGIDGHENVASEVDFMMDASMLGLEFFNSKLVDARLGNRKSIPRKTKLEGIVANCIKKGAMVMIRNLDRQGTPKLTAINVESENALCDPLTIPFYNRKQRFTSSGTL